MDRDWHERHILAAQVKQLVAEGDFTETYAGLVMDPDANRALVYRVASGASRFDAAVRALGDGRIQLLDAPHSHQSLESLREQIGNDERIRWSTLSVRPDGSAVVVGVRTPEEKRRVAKLLAGQPVNIELRNPQLL